MDQDKFDALVQKIASSASRRGVVRGAVSSAMAVGLGTVAVKSADAKKKGKGKDKDKGGPEDERCAPNGRKCGKCGKKKNGKPRCKPCKKCCSRYSEKAPNGTKRCQCKRDGMDCRNGAQCCSGSCTGGVCGFVS